MSQDASQEAQAAEQLEAATSNNRDDYFPIPLAIMQPGTVAPVNLYVYTGEPAQFILYKRAQAPLREEIRERLMQHDVDSLYLLKTDRDAYYDYVEENLSSIIRDNLMPQEKACQLVYESSSRVMEDTFENPRSGRNLRRAHDMVEATVLSIVKDPESIWHMAAMASHDYYTFTHCVHVSMFLVAGARDVLGITDRRTLMQIGLGGIFHDIGKSQIPEDILNKPGRLTHEEFEQIKKHPDLGLRLVKRARNLVAASGRIIRNHHEHYDGHGYPDGLIGEGIADVVRLATVIDVYDALTTKRCYADARSAFEALAMMLKEMDGLFDENLLRSFIKYLGPKETRLRLRARWDAAVRETLGEELATAPA
jgi:HD-GYP domain-containing protein (c-di-GMP phosphodiesterase class II)